MTKTPALWRGKWVWAAAGGPHGASFALFRRCFTLDRPADDARPSITASHADELGINGELAGWASAFSGPQFQNTARGGNLDANALAKPGQPAPSPNHNVNRMMREARDDRSTDS